MRLVCKQYRPKNIYKISSRITISSTLLQDAIRHLRDNRLENDILITFLAFMFRVELTAFAVQLQKRWKVLGFDLRHRNGILWKSSDLMFVFGAEK